MKIITMIMITIMTIIMIITTTIKYKKTAPFILY